MKNILLSGFVLGLAALGYFSLILMWDNYNNPLQQQASLRPSYYIQIN